MSSKGMTLLKTGMAMSLPIVSGISVICMAGLGPTINGMILIAVIAATHVSGALYVLGQDSPLMPRVRGGLILSLAVLLGVLVKLAIDKKMVEGAELLVLTAVLSVPLVIVAARLVERQQGEAEQGDSASDHRVFMIGCAAGSLAWSLIIGWMPVWMLMREIHSAWLLIAVGGLLINGTAGVLSLLRGVAWFVGAGFTGAFEAATTEPRGAVEEEDIWDSGVNPATGYPMSGGIDCAGYACGDGPRRD